MSAVGIARRLPVMDVLERLHMEKWAILLAVASITVWIVRVATIWAVR